ncbi:MAG: SDR family oxidoreductase [Bacteroidales bacterium]|nr:MAG: SDR family oxidoreductase [Bacteroidales bacterium]
MKNLKLKDKVAVITGASSGIGKAVTERFSLEGIKSIITARRKKELNKLSQNTGIMPVAGDITDPDLPRKLLDSAIKQYGRCDIIVNNAGILTSGKIEEIDVERVTQMVKINVEAAFRISYTFLKYFKAGNCGHLINISSVLGTKARPTTGAYAGTKYAIEALSEALRLELAGTNIRVSCIEPGLVMTELHNEWEVHPSKMFNISKPLQPEDIAEQIIFILKQPEHIRIPRLMILPGEHSI